MGARVTGANHLGTLLTRATPRPAPTVSELQPLIANLVAWQQEALKTSLTMQAQGKVGPPKPNDLQLGVKRARQRLREQGLSEDQP